MGLRSLYALVATGTTHTNSTAEAVLDSYAFPANFWQPGKRVRYKACALVASSNSTDTLTTYARVGAAALTGTAVFTSGAVDAANSDISAVDLEIVCESVSAAGVGVLRVLARGSDPDAPHSKLIGDAYTRITGLDTTAATYVGLTGDWSVAHADNQVACVWATADEITDGP